MKKSVISLFIFLIVFVAEGVFASESMRRCMLLPINDDVDGSIGFKVYEDVEYYLKNSKWCYYKSNAEILNILGNYRQNLNVHLNNKEVLKVLAEKSQSGSLIKITLNTSVKGIVAEIKVIGDNGEDIYFKERTVVSTKDSIVIGQTIKNWLDVYEKTIPYDARIQGILGEQFTIDAGKYYGVFPGNQVTVLRPVRKKRHPLLKEVVDWETKKIGEATVFHVSDGQSQARLTASMPNERLQLEDWVIIDKKSQPVIQNKNQFEEVKSQQFGKLGTVSLAFNFGTGSATNSSNNSNIKKIGGTVLGADLRLQMWATRNFWGGLDYVKRFSTYKQEEGTIVNASNSVSSSQIKIKFGYKYLPLGFFYGPQIDGYVGYARLNYGLDTATSDGFGEVTFKGVLLGTKGSMPIVKKIRAWLQLEFMYNPGYEEEVSLYGEDDSTSNFALELGGSYELNPTLTIIGGFNYSQSKAKFDTGNQEYKLKEGALLVGGEFTF